MGEDNPSGRNQGGITGIRMSLLGDTRHVALGSGSTDSAGWLHIRFSSDSVVWDRQPSRREVSGSTEWARSTLVCFSSNSVCCVGHLERRVVSILKTKKAANQGRLFLKQPSLFFVLRLSDFAARQAFL
jgi:hypothetical protein